MKYYIDGTVNYSPADRIKQIQQEVSQMTTKEKWELVRESFGMWKNSDNTNWSYIRRLAT